jgi:mono/diheme cytochrome c family protein
MGRQGSEMPAWSKVLTEQEIANVAEFVFQRFVVTAQKTAKNK